jgi:hypothetical protein
MQPVSPGRVDAFVSSTDKNFMVPVGGALVRVSMCVHVCVIRPWPLGVKASHEDESIHQLDRFKIESPKDASRGAVVHHVDRQVSCKVS